jgi:hypothetical protein
MVFASLAAVRYDIRFVAGPTLVAAGVIMDRERLKEVHQSDLTEGRINQDLVDWLQTKGMSYLLIVLVGICAYSAYVYYKRHKTNHQAEAWAELSKASLPGSLEDVAQKYGDVGAVSELARLQAARELLTAVQTGKMLGAEGEAPKDLAEKDRLEYLEKADGFYQKVAEADDQSPEKTLMVVTALNGRAAVAESLGKIDEARSLYEQVAKRAEATFPKLAEQARQRGETVQQKARDINLPSQADVLAMQSSPPSPSVFDPISPIDPGIRDFLMPKAK